MKHTPPKAVLLDTHALLWYADGSERLPVAIRELLLNPQTQVYVSTVSFWELATLTSLGRIRLTPDLTGWFAQIRESGCQVLDIADRHLTTYAKLPFLPDHRDPFDRLLIAQALAENLTLVSRDAKFARYPVRVQW